jgi:hypothetical protein
MRNFSAFPFLLLLVVASLPVRADGLTVQAASKGAQVNAGAMGTFIVEGPILTLEDKTSHVPTVEVNADGSGYTLKYDTGLVIHAVITAKTNTVTFSFDKIPDNGQLLQFKMGVPISFDQGGKVGLSGNPSKPIPAKSGGQFVIDGSVTEFDLSGAFGGGFSITTPLGWQCLQDNRVFNDESFVWNYNYELKTFPDKTSFDLVFTAL